MAVIDVTGSEGSGAPMTSSSVSGASVGDLDFQVLLFTSAAHTITAPSSDGNGTWAMVADIEEPLSDSGELVLQVWLRTLTGAASTAKTWSTDPDLGEWATMHFIVDPVTVAYPFEYSSSDRTSGSTTLLFEFDDEVTLESTTIPTSDDTLVVAGLYGSPIDVDEVTATDLSVQTKDGAGDITPDSVVNEFIGTTPTLLGLSSGLGTNAGDEAEVFISITGTGATADWENFAAGYFLIQLGEGAFEPFGPITLRRVEARELPYDVRRVHLTEGGDDAETPRSIKKPPL